MVKQLSVFIENKRGRLAELTKCLKQHNIDLIALSIADTTNFGILRCIVSDPEKALVTVREGGFTANITEVLAVSVSDAPGGLSEVLEILAEKDISVEYLYSFVRHRGETALVFFRVEDLMAAAEVLAGHGIQLHAAEEVYAM